MHYKRKLRTKVQSSSFFVDSQTLCGIEALSAFYHQSKSRIVELALKLQGGSYEELCQAKKRAFKKAKKIHAKQIRDKHHKVQCKKMPQKQKCLFD